MGVIRKSLFGHGTLRDGVTHVVSVGFVSGMDKQLIEEIAACSSANKQVNLAALERKLEEMRRSVRKLGYSHVQEYYSCHYTPVPVICFGHEFRNIILVFAPNFDIQEKERGLALLSSIYASLTVVAECGTNLRLAPLSAGTFAGRHFDAVVDALSGSPLSRLAEVCAYTEKEFRRLTDVD